MFICFKDIFIESLGLQIYSVKKKKPPSNQKSDLSNKSDKLYLLCFQKPDSFQFE